MKQSIANDTSWKGCEQCESCGAMRYLPAFSNVCGECGGPHGEDSWNVGVGKYFQLHELWYLIESRFVRPVKDHPAIVKIAATAALEVAVSKAKSAAEIKAVINNVPVGT